ncbi:MAG: group II intron reverse transcriptase domain-containing protein [Treponema sp.]|nr:group II intron reverse transcriptase domain-containing protein [Treponema sp.]
MKRAKSLFDRIVSYDNLRLAWVKARKGKTSKKVVRHFSRDVNRNLEKIRKRIVQEPPEFSSYIQFKIFDPKERTISVVPFSDRVIHHAVINILEPVFERQLIFHTYACRKGKGTHAAARYAFGMAKSAKCFLKLDVRKYFDSVDHGVLKNQLCRIIKDGRCLELLFSVIDSYCTAEGKGLPIGNLTSQFFANLYISPLDHFVLEKLKPKGYVRYMDDIVVFSDSMETLSKIFCSAETFCAENLHLTLKPPSFGFTKDGVPFLGWLLKSSGVRLLRKTKHRMRVKIRSIENDFQSGWACEEKTLSRIESVLAARKLYI